MTSFNRTVSLNLMDTSFLPVMLRKAPKNLMVTFVFLSPFHYKTTMIETSLTFVPVGPVNMRSPSFEKKL